MTTPMIAGHLVRCKSCDKTGLALEGQNVHDALDCPCCPSSTHTHAGPDQETAVPACRNVHVLGLAVVVPAVGGDVYAQPEVASEEPSDG